MIKYIYKFTVLILVVVVAITFLRWYKVSDYALAIEDGEKMTCSDFQKGVTKHKGDCWSCPQGFQNSPAHIFGNPENKKHCRKKAEYVNAIFHSKPTGLLKTKCETKAVWFKNKSCWTCPTGYKPARIKEIDNKAQCKPEEKYTYSVATKIGEAKCGDGAWSPPFSKTCFICPEGFKHNKLPRTTYDFKATEDPKACKRKISLMDSILDSN
jgi:hypothetical protein